MSVRRSGTAYRTFFHKYFHPAGMVAISRWLSAATSPESGRLKKFDPGGVVAYHATCVRRFGKLASRRDALRKEVCYRWCRCAQPPANRWHPSGIKMFVFLSGTGYQTYDYDRAKTPRPFHGRDNWIEQTGRWRRGRSPFVWRRHPVRRTLRAEGNERRAGVRVSVADIAPG